MPPLVRSVDLDLHKPTPVTLSDGNTVMLTLLEIESRRDSVLNAIRDARAWLRIDDQTVGVPVANYHLPQRVGAVQVDCTVIRDYYEGEDGGTRGAVHTDKWYLEKDARLRLWPADSPWIEPGTFRPPLKRPLVSGDTFIGNEPVSPRPGGEIYYHIPADFGGAEGYEEVYSATDGLVVVVADQVAPGDHPASVSGRHDRVLIQDDRGWYYKYDHLLVATDDLEPGQRITQGQRIGWLGKEGTSGGWAHLHFEIQVKTPCGEYGYDDPYAYLWQAYQETERPRLIAVARPRRMAKPGEPVRLDGTRSWPAQNIAEYRWYFTDGTEAIGPIVEHRYDQPGIYCETLKVTDRDGQAAYDFVTVHIGEYRDGELFLPAQGLYAACHPTRDVKVGDEVTFFVRVRGVSYGFNTPIEVGGEEVWDFGDASEPARTRSNVDASKHAPEGYAKVTHRYQKPGDYLASVRRVTDEGYLLVNRVHVSVTD